MGRDEEERDDGEGEFHFLADAETTDDGDASSGETGAFEFGEEVETDSEQENEAEAEAIEDGVEQSAAETVNVDRTQEVEAVNVDHDDGSAHRDDGEEHHDADEQHGDDHAHHPVVEDWPRGVGEASWWPIVTALGAAAVYVSVALFLLGRGRNSLVSPAVGPLAFVGAVGITLFGVYGWLYHGFVAHFWTRGTDRRSARSLRWGMLGFVASEIATFGALFAYYFYIRAGPWPPANSRLGDIDLLNVLVVNNTAVLVLSSITLHFAHHALADGKRDRFRRLLGITIGLGGLFLAGQLVEYHEFVNQEAFDWTSGLLGSAFFGLTGLHGLHVALGTLLLGITYVRGVHGQFDAERDVSVAMVSLYWHFVDAVWIFLVIALYAGASIYRTSIF
jgi:cytochrome c oxidase subunit 3